MSFKVTKELLACSLTSKMIQEVTQELLACPLTSKNDPRGNARASRELFLWKIGQKRNARRSRVAPSLVSYPLNSYSPQ